MTDQPKLAIIYYSSTGHVDDLVAEYAAGAEKAGAQVRVRRVAELAPPEAIATNPEWQAHHDAVADEPVATPDDADWADAIVFGTPTRFGNVAAQLKQYIDSLGGLWAEGRLADKVYSGLTSTATPHGGHESTLLALYNTVHHFGGILVTPGYTADVFDNPYGPSHTDGQGSIEISEHTRAASQAAGERVAHVTALLLAGRAAHSPA
ncbi:MAG: NAD(P)H:quinone oxidoreductase [Sporichthyaceae bacterium]